MTPAWRSLERDALGRDVGAHPRILKTPTPGQGLALALDARIQYVAERELDAIWRQTGAKSGMVLAMEPRTGDILAMAIRPTFNPNAYQARDLPSSGGTAGDRPVRAGLDVQGDPGRGRARGGGGVAPGPIYGEQGVITIANRTIHDWKRYGWLSFREVLKFSSNVGSIKIGLALGRERYYKHVTGFGFGALTGSGLPGESRGQLPSTPPVVRAVAGVDVDRPGDLGHRAPDPEAPSRPSPTTAVLMQPRMVRAILDAEGREVRRLPAPRPCGR